MIEITIVGYKKGFAEMFEKVFVELNTIQTGKKKITSDFTFYFHELNNQSLSNGHKKYFYISKVSISDFIQIFNLFGQFSEVTDWKLFLNCPETKCFAEVHYQEFKPLSDEVFYIKQKRKNSAE